MKTRRPLSITALAIPACAALAACSSAPPPVLKTAAPSPADSAAAVASAPLTPVAAPAEASPMSPFAKRLAAVIDGAKSQVTPFAIDLDALPQITVQESLDAKTAAKLDRSKLSEDADLTVKPADGYARQYMLAFGFKDISKVAFAHLRVQGQYGVNEGWFGAGFGNTMNTYLTCGGTSELVPVHSETLSFENHHAVYTMSDGVLDRQACKILSVKKWTAKAKPLFPNGILYGFRACVGSCKESEELTLLFPRSSASAAGALGGGAEHLTGSFSAVSFPIQRGGGGAFVARIMRRDVDPWQIATEAPASGKAGVPVDDAARVSALFLTSFELGVEVSQSTDDEAAVAIAYMDIDPATIAPIAPPTPKAQAPQIPPPAGRIGFNALDSRN